MGRSLTLWIALLLAGCATSPAWSQGLPGAAAWTDRRDPASAMVEKLHEFSDRENLAALEGRKARWAIDVGSPEAHVRSVEPNRDRFARMLGLVDPRVAQVELEYVSSPTSPAQVGDAAGVAIFAVRWSVYPDAWAEGLLLVPEGEARADLVALPDTSSTPETLAGLKPGPGSGLAFRLARQGCRILVPTIVDRTDEFSGNPRVRMTNLSHREWIYRMAYEAGRNLAGYEVDEVRAAVDWLLRTAPPGRAIGVLGHGEGGRVALHAGAIDQRIAVTYVAGYFGPREQLWREPIDRNVWGLLTEFGDAELAALIAPRGLIVEACGSPSVKEPLPSRDGRSDASGGIIEAPSASDVAREFRRIPASAWNPPRNTSSLPGPAPTLIEPAVVDDGPDVDHVASDAFLRRLGLEPRKDAAIPPVLDLRSSFDPRKRMQRLVTQLVDHTQRLIRTSELRRDVYWSKVDRSSPEAWRKSIAPLRQAFEDDLIGKLPEPSEPPVVRSVPLYDEPRWVGHGVELTVSEGVVASGILLLPKDIKPGERRPVVVCQHGLEGRPEQVCDPRITSVYRAFGAQLADRGFIVYAPQNPYVGHDRFRTLQRKLNPLKLSLFSIIVRQHQQTLRWLASLPSVDPGRIAFYGLSYGGKTAMRVPAILDGYCLSICSGDFNEWVVKTTNIDRPESYMYTVEYDMYEFGLSERFNYAEMAGLIAPRPFMVERGHRDGVAPDEWIGYEFAKVKRTYDRMNLADRVAIAYFDDGHRIDGGKTFPFLARHLNWPEKR